MKKILYILLILSLFLLFLSCSKWVKTLTPTVIYLPDEAENQGDTIYVDSLSYIHFTYTNYETTGNFQISYTTDFSELIFDNNCHEYNCTNIDLETIAEIPIVRFQLNKRLYCRIRFLAESYFLDTYEWSDGSPIGYFTLALSKADK